jgi:hypothetical protein
MPLLHALAPPRRAVWETLQTCTADALDTFPMPVCEHIRANRCHLEKAFRGYRASHRDYFHGVKVHLWVASGGFIAAFWLTPGSWHDLTGLYGMALDIPEGSQVLYQSPSQSSQIPARAESPHSLPSPPLVKGGEGRGEGGFESCASTNFGNAIGISGSGVHGLFCGGHLAGGRGGGVMCVAS